jgi:hypothetical protein
MQHRASCAQSSFHNQLSHCAQSRQENTMQAGEAQCFHRYTLASRRSKCGNFFFSKCGVSTPTTQPWAHFTTALHEVHTANDLAFKALEQSWAENALAFISFCTFNLCTFNRVSLFLIYSNNFYQYGIDAGADSRTSPHAIQALVERTTTPVDNHQVGCTLSTHEQE